MPKLTPVDDFGQPLDRNTTDEDGFARARWTTDEDGFMKARVRAVDIAKSQMANATHAEHKKVIKANRPNAFSREVDGVDGASDDAIKR
jgi:hypothetical protein